MRLVAAEFRKLTYQRAMWGLLIAGVLFAMLGTIATPFIIDQSADGLGFGTLAEVAVVDSVYANAISAYIFSVIVGVLIVAGEFRHGTAVATFVAAPQRGRVLLAKLWVAAIAGLVLQVIATAAGFGAGALAMMAFPDAATPSVDIFINTSIGAVVSGAVLGILGAAVGALLRSQVLALMSVLIWLFAIEPILLLLVPDQGKYFLSGLITSMVALDVQSEQFNLDTGDFLSPLVSIGFLLAYGAIFSILALISSMRRDIE